MSDDIKTSNSIENFLLMQYSSVFLKVNSDRLIQFKINKFV